MRELLTTQLPGATTYFVRDSIQLVEPGPATATYYVATNGSDNAAGSSEAIQELKPARPATGITKKKKKRPDEG